MELFGPQEVEDGGEQGGVPVDEDLQTQTERREDRNRTWRWSQEKQIQTHGSGFILQSRDAAAQEAEDGKQDVTSGDLRSLCSTSSTTQTRRTKL